ncbi:MAG TPA: hypothetical protein VF028_09400 [Actinomycetota bacterium]|nr:hypothetical protein [Actinomycetota bacterium]
MADLRGRSRPRRWRRSPSRIKGMSWVLPALIGIVALGIAFRPFLRSLARTSRLQLLAAGATFVVGAAGLEMVAIWYVSEYRTMDMTYVSMATVEETLEMVAVAILLYALFALHRLRVSGRRVAPSCRARGLGPRGRYFRSIASDNQKHDRTGDTPRSLAELLIALKEDRTRVSS